MTMNPIDKTLVEALLEKGIIEKSKLDILIDAWKTTKEPFRAYLIKQGLVKENEIIDALCQKMNIPRVNAKQVSIEKSALERIPVKFASYYKFMPVSIDERTLTVAVPYPFDVKTQDEIMTHLGYEIRQVLATENDVMELLRMHYGLAADTIQKIMLKTPKEKTAGIELEEGRVEDIEKLAEDASVVKLVNQIILEGFKKRATDIHIEPYRDKVRLRYRIDGILYDARAPEDIKHFLLPILSRIKIMSNLNIVERRLPQDGRAVVKIQDQTLDLRISSMPTPFGESIVIRILPTKMLFSLENLGLSPVDLKTFETLIKRPYGIVFVTGPTGSGKTTTLYTCLNKINTENRKILTIEDPIEYEMAGITQIQVSPEIGLDFAKGLRSMLRHDPDVMMVGEVRDLETAEIAIRVALTGHLVFSTLHTNDAASGATRLIDIGLEPYLVSSSVVAFIAQRLVRVICPHCREVARDAPKTLKEQIARELKLGFQEQVKIFRGKGCRECNFTGFYGRTAVYEILMIAENIKELIVKKVPAGHIKSAAIQNGMRTLRQEGWDKVIKGITTPEEVMNVTQADEEIAKTEVPRIEPVREMTRPPAPKEEVSVSQGPSVAQDQAAGPQEEELSGFPENQRVFRRLFVKINITYRLVDSAAGKKSYQPERYAVTKNISAGGLLFVSSTTMPKDSIIELKISLPDGGEPLECLGKVIRVIDRVAEASFDVATSFLDLSNAERTRIDKFVDKEME